MANGRVLFVTGSPGVGKTTLIIKVVEKLRAAHPGLKVQGFYTRELREQGERVGFEVVTVNGEKKDMLASIKTPARAPMVGRYKVNVSGFEALALPELQPKEGTQLFVVDEVGKMELFSPNFFPAVEALLHGNALVLGSVPLKHSSKQVEQVLNHPGLSLFTIDRTNRDQVTEEIFTHFNSVLDFE